MWVRGFYLVLVLAEGLKDVGLTSEISIRVLQTPQKTLLQDQNRDPELVPQQLHSPEQSEKQQHTGNH